MALSIGELAGYLTLDDTQFEQGLNKAKGKFESAGSKLKDQGKKLGAAAGLAAGAAIAAGIASNIDVGKANDKLAAQLGLTEKESKRIGKVAGGLYRDAYGDSIEGVNDAVGAVMSSIEGMSNASGKRLEAVTAKALDFAAAFEIDVARGSQVAGQLIKTGLARNATEAFDLLTAGAQKVPAALREDLVDAADEYGQFFAGLGYDGQQAFAMLVDASEKGMYGIDKAGDAIKEFTIRATDMSTSSKDAYKAIGLDAQTMANDILAGGDKAQGATQKIIDGLLSIKDPAKQGEAAIALFGTPLEDLNAQEIPKFLKSMRGTSDSMDDTAGASKRLGKTLNDNFATRLTGWKRTAQGFVQDGLMAIVAGFEKGGRAGKGWKADLSELGAFIKDPLMPAVKGVGRFMLENAKAFAAVGLAVGGLMVGLKIYRGVLAIVTGVQLVATGATRAYGLAMKFGRKHALGTRIQLGLLAAQTVITTAVTKVAMFATKAWTIAQRALNFALRMNPIGMVITALVLLGIGLAIAWRKSSTFRKVVTAAWSAIKHGVSVAWNKGIKPALLAMWRFIRNDLMPIVRSLWSNVVRPVFGFIGKAIGVYARLIVGYLKLWWSFLRNVLFPVIRFLWHNVVAPVFRGIGAVISGVWRNVIHPVFRALRDFVQDKLVPAFRTGIGAIETIWNGLKKAARTPVEFLVNTVYMKGIRAMMNKIPGVDLPSASFATGGSTGPGSKDQPAGIVHADEHVFTKEEVRRAGGHGVLERARAALMRGYAAGGRVVWPVPGRDTSTYPGHDGVDINRGSGWDDYGDPISSATSGRVAYAGSGRGYGNAVFINSPYGQLVYGHMSSILAGAGQSVTPGELIGRVGSTGNSSAPHLHFGFPGGSYSAALALLQGAGTVAPHGGKSPEQRRGERRDGKTKDSWWDAIKALPDLARKTWGFIKGMSGSGWAGEFKSSGSAMLRSAASWADDKIPDKLKLKWLPDVNLPNTPITSLLEKIGVFDSGGYATGAGYMPKRTIKPERVLSNRQTEAFERLVAVLDRGDGPGTGGPTIHQTFPASATPESVASAAGGRVVAALSAMGV